MTEKKSDAANTAPESAGAEAAIEAAPPEPTLTEVLAEQFGSALGKDGAPAYGRWGFALFHSLTPEQSVEELIRLKIKPRDALDHYNLGCHSAERGKTADAAEHFAQALKLDPKLAEARYNLALMKEKQGEIAAAKKLWNEYLETCEPSEETTEIKNHLAELAGR